MTNPTPQQLPASVIRCMSARDKAALGLDGVRTGKETAKTTKPPVDAPRGLPRGRLPNKTEAEYARLYLAGEDARYEGLTFRLKAGHKYTPDFVVTDEYGIRCIEVKGSYRFGSHQRARLAFDQARIEWPGIRWVWAVRQSNGAWKIT